MTEQSRPARSPITWRLGFLLAVIFNSVIVTRCSAFNHPPRFVIDGQTEIVLRLKEGAETPAGSLIYRLVGEDLDGDPLTFGVRSHGDNDILKIENLGTNEALVYLKKELDRETKDEYAVVLTLTDGRLGEGNFITQSLLLLVEDVNDNGPIFKPYQPTIVVQEDSEPGILTTLEATDLDEGAYGQVLYSLQEVDGEDHMFSISTVNGRGIVRLVGQLDYERKFLYQIRVLAIDRSNNDRVNTGTAAIVVKVQDVEDQPPEFVLVSPVTRIGEDAHIGTSVLRVKAVDGDRGINNRIRYSITQGARDIFDINTNSGVVFTLEQLDRESTTSSNGAYILEITAHEESQSVFPAPTATTEVTIIVTDLNDEIPTFRSPNYVAEINEHAPVNTPVTFLPGAIPEVFDHDQGNNGTFQMFLDGDQGIFEVTPPKGINEASFLIRVKDSTKLDFEKISSLNFTVIAREMVPTNAKYSIVPVTVHIRDINDNFPEFTQPLYEVSVPENAAIGATVAWIQALDEDSGQFGSQGIRYTNLGGGVAELLTLDPVSGIITVKSNGPAFDRELVSRHYLTVEARDDLGHGNRNTVQLIINIEDVNDNAPMFLQNKYEARLTENSPDFDSPLIIEARDLDLNGTRNSQLHYSLLSGNGSFTIDTLKGVMQPLHPLDFEQLGGNVLSGVRALTLTVQVQDLGEPSLWSEAPVTVYVMDVNDHGPIFQLDHYEKAIPEDTAGGTEILQVTALDADGSFPNNAVVYRIAHGAGDKFVIGAESGIISIATGANLDPDHTEPKTNHYTLTVMALDGGIGVQQRHATVQVNISIIDVNNKAPVFVDPGTVRVRENAHVGTVICHLSANDPDEKPVLRYHIDPTNSGARAEEGTVIKPSDYDYLGALELNALNGELRVIKLLDRERVETIRLAVIVEDLAASQSKQTSMAVLTIIVEDENDNNPSFRRPFYRRSITENSKNGVSITNIVADDADKNRTITYSLEGPRATTDLLYLDSVTGEVVVANKIDHEVFPWLNFTVRATDSGVPPRSSLVDVFIQVLDENDNNPYFVGDVSNITVREDAPVGTEIAVIEARDADSGDYGKVTYLLDRMSSQGKFQIDPETGVVKVADKLNREEQSVFMLVIEAWDNYQFGYTSGESRNSFKQVSLNIVDVNDETPVIEPIVGCATITEFHEPREAVTVIKATDADDPNTPNGRITFTIVGGNDLGLFKLETLDFSWARVTTTRSLKGLYGNYTLQVKAQDLGTPPNAALTDVDICVLDFNDNAPQFVSPPNNVTIRVPENATIGSAVLQVQAVDADIGLNGAVRYHLKQDPLGNWRTFAINEVTGVVELRKPLDRERQKVYEIRVESVDLGIPSPLSSDLDLTIYVTNVNDFEPQFLVDEFTVNFTEHTRPGVERQPLVETVDRDELDDLGSPAAPVCYFIVGGNEKEFFKLEPLRHDLMVAHELDREEMEKYELIVKASEDCAHIPETTSGFNSSDDSLLRVIVNVIDINDNSPRFVKRIFTGGVTTEADFGVEFMQVKAIDLDAGENAIVTYYQMGRMQKLSSEGLEHVVNQPFLVDAKTGGISLNFDPQKGMKGYFDFMVLANDTGGRQDMARVFIYLLREDQQVRFVLRQHPHEVRQRIDLFRDVLSNVTGSIVNVDEFKVHENRDGSVDKTKTDLYLHLVNRIDNSILDVDDVLRLVDQNIELLDTLFKDFNVLDTQPAEAALLQDDSNSFILMWLVGTTIFMGLLLIVAISVCLSQRQKYQRQLKAATVAAFGSNESDLIRVTGRVPNTNMHSVEGSNPIWMQAYKNEWYKEDDSLSQMSERDSLDAVVNGESRAGSKNSKPYFGQGCTFTTNSCDSQSNMIQEETGVNVKEQNDLNRTGMNYQENLYQHLEKLGNPLIVKKLETTEL